MAAVHQYHAGIVLQDNGVDASFTMIKSKTDIQYDDLPPLASGYQPQRCHASVIYVGAPMYYNAHITVS